MAEQGWRGDGEAPRSGLDELFVQLDAVARTSGRVQDLLEATLSIVGTDLELDAVLRRIVEAAVGLVQATYGALGVISETGHLARFIPVGVDEETIYRIGRYPHGRGILGLLIDDPRPLRLSNIADHPGSYGLPAHHPPMRTFLGVPIRTRDEVYGNLYLAEKQDGGEFSADDEAVLGALAAVAGVVIDDVRLYDASRRRERWAQAITEITRTLLSGTDPAQTLTAVAEHARHLAAADAAFVALPLEGSKDLVIEAADGVDADGLVGVALPLGTSLAGSIFQTGRAEILTDLGNNEYAVNPVADSAVRGPAVYVPLGAPGAVRGVLAVLNRPGQATFGPAEQAMLDPFADQAAVVLELARRRIEAEHVTMLEDRDRIARGLHDVVIQRLYATGMSLSGVSGLIEPAEAADRVSRAVDDLDDTIREIRATIYALQQSRAGPGTTSLWADLLQEINEATDALGFAPSLRFDGPLDSQVPQYVGQHVVVIVREALSNAARHAQATRVEVAVSLAVGELTVTVRDNGVGMPADVRPSGLGNLQQRATVLGGQLRVDAPPEGGVELTWRVPLSPSGSG